MDELEIQRKRLLKALEQGEKINNLTSAPEWEFFEGWIRSLQEAVDQSIHSDDFVNNHEGYIKALAMYQCYESIFDGINKFKKTYESATHKIIELDKYQDG
jgi:hypothetical protein